VQANPASAGVLSVLRNYKCPIAGHYLLWILKLSYEDEPEARAHNILDKLHASCLTSYGYLEL
jgi:hypothetical protein